jgi:hypothetical protein
MTHRPSSAAPTEFTADQVAHAYPAGIENDFWNVARNRIVQRELRRACRRHLLAPSARILEIGCGKGIVVHDLLGAGWDAWGVELATPAPIEAVDSRIFTGLRAEALPEAFRVSVRCLLFLDVIEHIADAPAFLRDTVAAFPGATLALLTVPARPEAWSNYDTYYGHFRRYTPALLAQHMAQAGLVPVKIAYFFHSLYVAAMAIKLAGRIRAVVRSAPRHTGLHGLVARCLAAESRLLAHTRIPGLSLLAVAQLSAADVPRSAS